MTQMNAPIFILSEFRSGSTLVRYVLDSHPSVCCPAELRLAALCQRALQVGNLLRGVESSGADTHINAECLGWVRRIIDDAMAAYCERKAKTRWCDKSPANIDLSYVLNTVFPDAQYLCLYRHGLDQAYSTLAMDGPSRFDWRPARYGGHLVAAALDRWCSQAEKLLAFEHSNSNCLRVLYETFVEHPEDELLRITTFLGLPHVPGLSVSAFERPHDPGPADSKISTSTAVDSGRIGKGRALDMRGVPLGLQQRFNRLLRVLGYEEAPASTTQHLSVM